MGDEFSWIDEISGDRMTNTWYVDDAIRAYMNHLDTMKRSSK